MSNLMVSVVLPYLLGSNRPPKQASWPLARSALEEGQGCANLRTLVDAEEPRRELRTYGSRLNSPGNLSRLMAIP
jgi:hypothetical protein